MKRIWIKLYLDILDDIEFGELPEFIKWRAIELFLVAGENGDDGLLPSVKRLAWRLRLDEDKINEALSTLALVGVVHETPDGWCVTHFKDRQYSESYERVKRYRNAKSNGTCNENVTDILSSSTSSSDSILKNGNAFEIYEKNIGILTPAISDGLKTDIDQYSEDWVISAIEYATRKEKRSLSYIDGCLKGWKRDGLTQLPTANSDKPKDTTWRTL
jgi:DnaD/phage-associated family protein